MSLASNRSVTRSRAPWAFRHWQRSAGPADSGTRCAPQHPCGPNRFRNAGGRGRRLRRILEACVMRPHPQSQLLPPHVAGVLHGRGGEPNGPNGRRPLHRSETFPPTVALPRATGTGSAKTRLPEPVCPPTRALSRSSRQT